MPHAAAENEDERWRRHYDLLMKQVADMPALGAKAPVEILRRVERARAAVPGLRAALLARPQAWAHAHGALLELARRAPDDERRGPLIGLLLCDPDEDRRLRVDALLPKRASAFRTVWVLRLSEDGSRRALHELRKRLESSHRGPHLVLAAAWRAWQGDGVGREHLEWALGASELDETPWVLLAAGLSTNRLLRTSGPWMEVRSRLLEVGRRRLAEGRHDDVRVLLATVVHAEQVNAASMARFWDLHRQVLRRVNLNRRRWDGEQALARALEEAERIGDR